MLISGLINIKKKEKMITGTYNLVVDPSWRNVQQGEVFLECDTTLAPVTINLFSIASLDRFWNVKLVISDVNNNAGTNNITINSNVADAIDEDGNNQIVLNTNGESVILQVVSENSWSATQSTGGGGGGATEYKQALLPSSSLVTASIPQPDLVGVAISLGTVRIEDYPFINLDNGNVGIVYSCLSVLPSGIFIYEVNDIETTDPIKGYWVAFKQSTQDPRLLEKVAELQMTQQFWDNWYNWTVKDSGDNVVKFIYANYPNSDSVLIESFITTVTYTNGTLSATDTYFDFGGETVLSLYNSLSGYGVLTGSFEITPPEYILDDDFYGMALGSQAGWYYYRNVSYSQGNGENWNCVGFNLLTGETRWVTPVADIIASVTNFNFAGVVADNMIQRWFNHPNGITFAFSDAQPINFENNVNGVTCIWSPYYQNPNEVIYLNQRYSSGRFVNINGTISPSWYWDNVNIFQWQPPSYLNGEAILMTRYNTNTKEITIWIVPNLAEQGWGFSQSYANNNGMALLNNGNASYLFGQFTYIYFTSEKYYSMYQSNNNYPTNMIGNKSYSTNSGLFRNLYSIGVEIDEYDGVIF